MIKKPNSKEGWGLCRWSLIEAQVRKLQKKIYLAAKAGDFKLLRRLQGRLVDSYSAKRLAVRRVTQDNSGRNIAGVDGVKRLPPLKRLSLAIRLKIFTKSRPLRRHWVPKPGKAEKSPLGIPRMSDRAVQALFKLALEPEWESRFGPNSYGFRPGRGSHDAVKQIFNSICKKPKYVLYADIRKCFDRIEHSKLLLKCNFGKGRFDKQLKSWLKSGVVDQDVFSETDAGTPQGGVISPVLANIALHGMENMLNDLVSGLVIRHDFPSGKGKAMGKRDKMKSLGIVVYADDFVVMHRDKDVVIKCKEAISHWLSDIGLELSSEKTRISHTLSFTEEDKADPLFPSKPGFDFLGFTIRQTNSKFKGYGKTGIRTTIIPSALKCKLHQQKLAAIIKNAKVLSQEQLIKKLNPIISGWARYFGLSDAGTCGTLKKMDYLLYLKLRRWAKRKTQSAKSGSDKYWRTSGKRNWAFETASGIGLHQHTDFARSLVTEYTKVNREATPFDGNEKYWATRLGRSPFISKTQSFLLKRQEGVCNLCKQKFTESCLLEIDHIQPLSKKGSRGRDNLQLLHKHCHDQKDSLFKGPEI
jgi:RNA-directed DNA polymerase